MIINLSNHPVSCWDEIQTEEAKKQYGIIKDIPFPQIDPNAGSSEIGLQAIKYLEICKKELEPYKNENTAIHLMGEHTFCFSLVDLLIKNKIKVLASTTTRESIKTKEGKLIKFIFKGFREYTYAEE